MRHVRPKYQVFISSTYEDLAEVRKAVARALLTAGQIPAGMEDFTAKDDRGWKTITRVIDQSDYYVLLVAGRYGSIDDSVGVSWTEREYDYARSKGVPVLAFLRERAETPGSQMDTDPRRVEKLAAFIDRIKANHMKASWRGPDDLAGKVTEAIRQQIQDDDDDGQSRPGWYRGDQVPSTTALDEFARLSDESARLREENARLREELGARDSGIYPQLKRLVDEGRTRVIVNNPVLLGLERKYLQAKAGHFKVVALSDTFIHGESLEFYDRSSEKAINAGMPMLVPLTCVEAAWPDPIEGDLIHLRLNVSMCLIDGRWTLR